jgi:hypothetical protein
MHQVDQYVYFARRGNDYDVSVRPVSSAAVDALASARVAMRPETRPAAAPKVASPRARVTDKGIAEMPNKGYDSSSDSVLRRAAAKAASMSEGERARLYDRMYKRDGSPSLAKAPNVAHVNAVAQSPVKASAARAPIKAPVTNFGRTTSKVLPGAENDGINWYQRMYKRDDYPFSGVRQGDKRGIAARSDSSSPKASDAFASRWPASYFGIPSGKAKE